jgi:intein/homing endonuclease
MDDRDKKGRFLKGRVSWLKGKKNPRRRKFNPIFDENLAYLVGVYMGDGWIIKNSKNKVFRLKAKDLDFVEKCQINLEKIFGFKPEIKIHKSQPNMNVIYLYSTDFADFLIKITNNKTKIPDWIWNASKKIQKQFIVGLMDSDGSMTKYRVSDEKYTWNAYQLYFCKPTKPYNSNVKKILDKLGCKTSFLKSNDGKRIHINIKSYFNAGLWFNIQRKQKNLEEYHTLRM